MTCLRTLRFAVFLVHACTHFVLLFLLDFSDALRPQFPRFNCFFLSLCFFIAFLSLWDLFHHDFVIIYLFSSLWSWVTFCSQVVAFDTAAEPGSADGQRAGHMDCLCKRARRWGNQSGSPFFHGDEGSDCQGQLEASSLLRDSATGPSPKWIWRSSPGLLPPQFYDVFEALTLRFAVRHTLYFFSLGFFRRLAVTSSPV